MTTITLYSVIIFCISIVLCQPLMKIYQIVAPPRTSGRKRYLLVYIPMVIFTGIISGTLPNGVRLLLTVLLYLAASIIYCDGKLLRKMLAWLLVIIITLVSEMLSMPIYTVLDTQYVFSNEQQLTLTAALATSFCFMLTYLLKHIIQLVDDRLDRRTWYRVIINMVLLAVCSLSYNMNIYVNSFPASNWFRQNITLINSISSIVLFCNMLLQLTLIRRMNSALKETELAHFAEQRAREELERVKISEEKETQLRILRHDMKNHLAAIDALGTGGDMTRQHEYIRTLLASYTSTGECVYTGNTLIDGMLSAKISAAEAKGFTPEYITSPIPKEIPIDDLQLCIVLGNLLDNAMNACSLTSEKRMIVELSLKDSVMAMRISNSCADPTGAMKSIKTGRSASRRGLGLVSVRASLQTLGGDMDHTISKDGTMIVCSVFIPLDTHS